MLALSVMFFGIFISIRFAREMTRGFIAMTKLL